MFCRVTPSQKYLHYIWDVTNWRFIPIITWSVIKISEYSQNAYPLLKPVAVSLTRLKARNGPNAINSSLT